MGSLSHLALIYSGKLEGISEMKEEITIIQTCKTKHHTSGKKKTCLDILRGHETFLDRKISHSCFCQAFHLRHSFPSAGEKREFAGVVFSPLGYHGGAHGWLQTWPPSYRSSLFIEFTGLDRAFKAAVHYC